MGKLFKREIGITLIALVVTIIILLILAGVAIRSVTGENGLFAKARISKENHEIAEEQEAIKLAMGSLRIEKIRESVMSNTEETLITPEELKAEMDKGSPKPASVEAIDSEGNMKVTFDLKRKNRSYDVTQEGEVEAKKVLTPEEAMQIVDVALVTDDRAKSFLLTAGGYVIEATGGGHEVLSEVNLTDNIITRDGIRKKGEEWFIDNKGKVYTWGSNRYGKLGAGISDTSYHGYSSSVPICISDIDGSALKGKNIIDIYDNSYFTIMAIDSEGKLYTWGSNRYGKLGAGISGTSYNTDVNSNVPICISDIDGNALKGKNIVEVYDSYDTILVKDNEGKLYTWGSNEYGKLGAGISGTSYDTDVNSNVPICISDMEGNALKGKNIVEVYDSYDTIIAKDNEGKLYTWGSNYRGKLGAGMSNTSLGSCSNLPICISDIDGNALKGKNIAEVYYLNNIILAKDSEGKLYTWGSNEYGQLGAGMSDTSYDSCSNAPICISDIEESVLKGKNIVDFYMSGGYYITILVRDDEGKLYTWGSNSYGKLGAGISDTESYSNVPICISNTDGNALKGKNIVEVYVIDGMILVKDNEGKLYTWGSNEYGKLGAGISGTSFDTDVNSNVPICISDMEGNALKGKNIVEVYDSYDTIIAKDNEGKLYTWGSNEYGKLGAGISDTESCSNVPICISNTDGSVLTGKKIVKINCLGAPYYVMLVEDDEGNLYAWGLNENGQLCAGITDSYSNVPICINKISGSHLNNKKIRKIFTWSKGMKRLYYITETNECYLICFSVIE